MVTDSTTRSSRWPVPLVVLVSASVITAVSLGVRSTFGLFQDPVIDELGLPRAPFALAIALQAIVWGVTQPIAGAIADRFGAARVIVVGAVVYAVGIVVLAASDGEASLLAFGVITGIATGSASFAVVLASVGRMASPERRSVALGIVTAMGSIGQFVLVPLARVMLDRADWRVALLVFAVIAAAMVLFAPTLRGNAGDHTAADAPPGRPLREDLRRAAHSRNYLLLNAAFLVCGFHVTFIATHLPAYVGDVGVADSAGSTALALIGLFNVGGSLLVGVLGATYRLTSILAAIYALRGVVITAYVLLPASSTTTIAFGALIGVLWLSTVPPTSAIVAQLFGTANAGALFGIVFLSHQVGAFAGAWMGGLLADSTGSYDAAWWTAVGLAAFATLMHLLIDERREPEQPPPPASPRLAPAGAAVVVAVAGVAVMASATAAATNDSAEDPPAYHCSIS